MKLLAIFLATVGLGLGFPAETTDYPVPGRIGSSAWGNTEIADCTFAAAANWEVLKLGYTPDEATIIHEFHQAGGIDSEGIYAYQFERYWRYHGIAGVKVKQTLIPHTDGWVTPMSTATKARIVRSLDRDHVLLAAWGGHEVVITGRTPRGFVYITYGEKRIVSWAVLSSESEGIWTGAVTQ